MKKVITIISIAVFILALIAINIFFNGQKDSQEQNKPEQKQEETSIIEVTSQNFEEIVLKSEQTVLIDFYATWCGPCKMLSPIIEEIAKEKDAVKFVRIDIDKAEDIAMQYQVRSIPTLVLIQGGRETDRRIGLAEKSDIVKWIEGKE